MILRLGQPVATRVRARIGDPLVSRSLVIDWYQSLQRGGTPIPAKKFLDCEDIARRGQLLGSFKPLANQHLAILERSLRKDQV
jgi:hypothetical protein